MRSFIILLLFTSYIISASAQPGVRGVLSGTVTDAKGNPLNGASIFIHDIKVLAIADSSGHYTTTELNPGRYLVEVTYLGAASTIEKVDVAGNTNKDFKLQLTAVEQEAVTVTGVSSATRLKNIPQAVSLIKRTDLLQNGSTNLMGNLARTAGVSVVTTGPAIAKPVIRGLGYNRVVTINDGIRQEGQQWGDEHGIEIDELSVQKAEILKGPASLMYGSDAMAGVINIMTNQPVTPGSIKGNLLFSETSNNNMQSYYGNIAGNLSNGLNWNAYSSLKSAGDYTNRYDGQVLNTRFHELNFGGYAGVNRAWGYTHLLVSNFHQKLGVPEGVRDPVTGKFMVFAETPYEHIATDDELHSKEMTTPYQQIDHFKIASDNSVSLGGSRLAATVAFQRNQRREFADPAMPAIPNLYFDLKTINYNLQLHLRQLSGWKTTIGSNGMYQQNRNLAPETLIPEYNLFDAGLFAYTTATFNKLTLSGGLRGDLRTMKIKQKLLPNDDVKFNAADKHFADVSGSIGAAYQASQRVNLKANLAKGFRAPNAAELSSNGAHEGTYRYEYGNIHLKTEKSLQADAGIELSTTHVGIGLNAFYNHIQDYIYYQRLPSVYGGDSLVVDNGVSLQAFRFNQADAALAGLEATIDIHPHPLDWLHFENSFSYVVGTFRNAIEGDKDLPFIPPARLTSELRANFAKVHSLRNLYFKIEMQATASKKKVFSAYKTETPTDGYILLNLGAGTDINIKSKTLCSIYLSANNITDEAYQDHLSRLKYTDVNAATGRMGIYNMGRSMNVRVNFPFNLKKR